MKVNLPIKREDSIDLEACDLEKGILLSKNPIGVIMWSSEDGYYYYYKSSDHNPFGEEGSSLTGLVRNITDIYPNIEFEYFENE